MATKTLYLDSPGTSVISNSKCSYDDTTITSDNLTSQASATLQWLFYLSDICGSEYATINSIKVSYKASSNRYSSVYTEGTARTGYLIQSGSGVANSKYSDKTIERDKQFGSNQDVYTEHTVTFNSSYDSWSGSHLFTYNGKKAAGIFISLINNYTVNFTFDAKELAIVVDYTEHTHSYGNPTYTWSSNGKSCTAKRSCSCGTSETANATITSVVKTAATCIAKGTTRYTATFGVSWATTQTKDVQDIDKKTHTWVAANCTIPKTCSVCGTTEGSALGHDYKSVVTPPTASSKGYTTHTCSRCGHSYTDSYKCLLTVTCNSTEGTVTGSGTYNEGANVTITATPKSGYKFIKWSDDNTFSSRQVTLNSSITYTATFEKAYYDIGYDNLFSLADWSRTDSVKVGGGATGEISYDLNLGAITVTSISNKTNNEAFTNYGSSSYTMTVEPETEYVFEADIKFAENSTSKYGQMFIFCYDANGTAVNGPVNLDTGEVASSQHIGIYIRADGTFSIKFRTPSDCYKLRTRVGSTDLGVITTYSNIGFYKKSAYDAYAKNYAKVRDSFKINESVTLMLPTREGYNFKGWNTKDDGTGTLYTGSKTFPAGSLVLYSTWERKTPIITFEPNGGTVSQTSKTVTYGQSYGELPTPTKEHYNFSGWYYNGEKITSSTTVTQELDHSLIASWTPKTYTLTYDARGGMVNPTSKEVAYGSKYGELPTPQKVGHTFSGWWTAIDGGDQVNSETIMTKDKQVIYAHWIVNKYIITFDGNGADNTGAMTTQQFKYGETKKLTKNVFTKEFYNFVNWKDEVGKDYADEEEITYLTESDKTLTAQWEKGFLGQILIGDNNYQVIRILIDTDKIVDKVYLDKNLAFWE